VISAVVVGVAAKEETKVGGRKRQGRKGASFYSRSLTSHENRDDTFVVIDHR
jgi:hypothetical protein